MSMKLIMRFKGNFAFEQAYTKQHFKDLVDSNFLKSINDSYDNNMPITLSDEMTGNEIQKKVSELKSIEIVFDN